MAYGFTATAGAITGIHSGFVAKFDTPSFPAGALNGVNAIDNGGGNLRAYTDDSKSTPLPLHVVTLVTGASAVAKVFVRLDTLATASTVYFEADDTESAQPAASSPLGKNSVWAGYYRSFSDDSQDSTGNSADALLSPNANSIADIGSSEGSLNFLFNPSAWTGYAASNKPLILRSSSGHLFQLLYNKFGSYRVFAFSYRASFGSTYEVKSTVTYLSDADFDNDHLIQLSWGSSGISIRVDRGGVDELTQSVTGSSSTYNKTSSSTIGDANNATDFSGLFVRNAVVSQNMLDTEFDSLRSPSTFWASGAWEDQGGAQPIDILLNGLAAKPLLSSLMLEQISTIGLSSLGVAPSVSSVSVTAIESIGLSSVTVLPALSQLSVSSISSIGISGLSIDPSVSSVTIKGIALLNLDNISCQPSLSEVDLNALSEVGVSNLSVTPSMSTLSVFSIPTIDLSQVSVSPSLRSLKVSNVGEIELSGLKVAPSLSVDSIVNINSVALGGLSVRPTIDALAIELYTQLQLSEIEVNTNLSRLHIDNGNDMPTFNNSGLLLHDVTTSFSLRNISTTYRIN